MNLRTLNPETVKNKVVVVTCNLDVSLQDGKITDNTRLIESIPTLAFILKHGAKRLHILSKIGRPKGQIVPELSQKILVPDLEKYLKTSVAFRSDFTPGNERVQLHENVRFWPGERKNDPTFVHELEKIGGEVFVMDAFATAHREEASIVGLAKTLPAYAGLLVQKEIDILSPFLTKKKLPGLVVVSGGAKLETKIPVLEHFAETAEHILLGGALANNFLVAKGIDVGQSLYQEDQIKNAQHIMNQAKKHGTGVHLPLDTVCAKDPESEQVVHLPVNGMRGQAKSFDIGPHTVRSYLEILAHAKTVIWNGPLGMFEYKAFQNGTQKILEYLASKQGTLQVVLGGGDTLDALKRFGISKDQFTHVSTGGGAMLEFLSGNTLPGIEILREQAV